jgi:hypothetical protein
MRAAHWLILIAIAGVHSQLRAQTPVYEIQAGLGYARLFDAGGLSFSAALERFISPPDAGLQHGLGGAFWYAHTGIASSPDDPEGRHVVGLGARYRMTFGRAGSFRPFLAVPVELLHSRIPDRAQLQAAALLVGGVPEPGPPTPAEDRIGDEWGWGTGLELGIRLTTGDRLSVQTSAQALYQNIYAGQSSNTAWNWHAGLSYGF